MKEFLQNIGNFVVFCIGFIVASAVGENSSHIGDEETFVAVIPVLQSLHHGSEI